MTTPDMTPTSDSTQIQDLTPREEEAFQALDRVLDRFLGETDWHATRRAWARPRYLHHPFDWSRGLSALSDYSDDELRAAIRHIRARTA